MPLHTNLLSGRQYRLSLKAAVGMLVVVHTCGLIGLLLPLSRPWFEAATPFSLCLSAFLLLYFHRDWNAAFLFFVIFTFLAGYTAEVAGVKTQLIFGEYFYKTALGFKIFEVPPLIGINWLMLVYASGVVIHALSLHWMVKSLLAAGLMTAMDLAIEPVAIQHNFWEWTGQQVPLQNYLGWYILSFVLACIFYLLPFRKSNSLASYLLAIQLFFFLFLQLGHYILA